MSKEKSVSELRARKGGKKGSNRIRNEVFWNFLEKSSFVLLDIVQFRPVTNTWQNFFIH